MPMRLELEKRAERSRVMSLVSPLIAIVLTIVAGAIMFLTLGKNPWDTLYTFFIRPLADWRSAQDVVVKAVPLVLIALGLAVCYRSNNWNIGAEGQFTAGAIAGSALPILVPDFATGWTIPLMLLCGALGGMVYGAIPALLKIRFNTNEILTSLMLVYIAQLVLDYLVRGPWRNPQGFNFPESRIFSAAQRMPRIGDGRMTIAVYITLAVLVILWIVLARSKKGFEVKVLGASPRAGAFAGFSAGWMTLSAFLVSGALAGLAGIMEVAGPVRQLVPTISPGYGFTAIIVAFLGRLSPPGILIAGFVLAVTYVGGVAAQISLRLPSQATGVFQGMLLFFVLACDTLILYRLRFVRGPRAREAARGTV